MGALDYLSNFCTISSSPIRKKRKPMQTVDIKVKMDCDGCERRVKHAASSMKVPSPYFNIHMEVPVAVKAYFGCYMKQGVRSVDVNRKQSRVTVSGYVEPKKVLKKVKSTGKHAEFWPYVPYNLVSYPYATQAYDKKAPSGFVRNVVQALPSPNNPTEQYATMFSDDNPNACSIM